MLYSVTVLNYQDCLALLQNCCSFVKQNKKVSWDKQKMYWDKRKMSGTTPMLEKTAVQGLRQRV